MPLRQPEPIPEREIGDPLEINDPVSIHGSYFDLSTGRNISQLWRTRPKRKPPPPPAPPAPPAPTPEHTYTLQGWQQYSAKEFIGSYQLEALFQRIRLFIGRTIGNMIINNNLNAIVNLFPDFDYFVNDFHFNFVYESHRNFKTRENPLKRVEVNGTINVNQQFGKALTEYNYNTPKFDLRHFAPKNGTDVIDQWEGYGNNTMHRSLQQILYNHLKNNFRFQEFLDILKSNRQDMLGTSDTLTVAYTAGISAIRRVEPHPIEQPTRYDPMYVPRPPLPGMIAYMELMRGNGFGQRRRSRKLSHKKRSRNLSHKRRSRKLTRIRR